MNAATASVIPTKIHMTQKSWENDFSDQIRDCEGALTYERHAADYCLFVNTVCRSFNSSSNCIARKLEVLATSYVTEWNVIENGKKPENVALQ